MTTTYQAPHEVRDAAKLAAMLEALRRGDSLPPVVVEPNGVMAVTGSHRLAAWREAEIEPDAIVLTDEEYAAACEYLGVEYFDEASDPESVCWAIHETTNREEVRVAVADQM